MYWFLQRKSPGWAIRKTHKTNDHGKITILPLTWSSSKVLCPIEQAASLCCYQSPYPQQWVTEILDRLYSIQKCWCKTPLPHNKFCDIYFANNSTQEALLLQEILHCPQRGTSRFFIWWEHKGSMNIEDGFPTEIDGAVFHTGSQNEDIRFVWNQGHARVSFFFWARTKLPIIKEDITLQILCWYHYGDNIFCFCGTMTSPSDSENVPLTHWDLVFNVKLLWAEWDDFWLTNDYHARTNACPLIFKDFKSKKHFNSITRKMWFTSNDPPIFYDYF